MRNKYICIVRMLISNFVDISFRYSRFIAPANTDEYWLKFGCDLDIDFSLSAFKTAFQRFWSRKKWIQKFVDAILRHMEKKILKFTSLRVSESCWWQDMALCDESFAIAILRKSVFVMLFRHLDMRFCGLTAFDVDWVLHTSNSFNESNSVHWSFRSILFASDLFGILRSCSATKLPNIWKLSYSFDLFRARSTSAVFVHLSTARTSTWHSFCSVTFKGNDFDVIRFDVTVW